MEDLQARQALRKRFFDQLSSQSDREKPTKQRKEEIHSYRTGKTSGEDLAPDNVDHETTPTQDHGILCEAREELTGAGTQCDPIRFATWETRNVISSKYHGITIELSDDEDEGEHLVSARTTLSYAIKSSGSGHVAGKDSTPPTQERASSSRTLLSVEDESSPFFDGSGASADTAIDLDTMTDSSYALPLLRHGISADHL